MSFLGLGPEEFWTNPYRTRDEVVDRLMDGGYLGYFVDAPPTADMTTRATLPLIGVRHLTLAEVRDVDFRRCATLVAYDVEGGNMHVSRAFPWKNPEKLAPVKGSDKPVPQGRAADLFKVALRQQLPALARSRGRVLVNLLVLDRSSNRVTIELQGEGATSPGGELRRVWPPEGETAKYSDVADLPPLPAEQNIYLEVPRVVLRGPGPRCEVRGRVRAKVLPRDVVPLPPADPQARSAWQPPDIGDRRATAVLPLTLVLGQAESLEALALQYMLPVYQDVDPSGGEVEAEFCVDLFAHPDMLPVAQTYQVWAYAGEHMIGPYALGVVGEERLVP